MLNYLSPFVAFQPQASRVKPSAPLLTVVSMPETRDQSAGFGAARPMPSTAAKIQRLETENAKLRHALRQVRGALITKTHKRLVDEALGTDDRRRA